MFAIPGVASEYLTDWRENADVSEETAMRFVLEDNVLTPRLDIGRPGDVTFDHAGKTALMLDSQVSHTIADHTLDVSTTDEGPQLVLRR